MGFGTPFEPEWDLVWRSLAQYGLGFIADPWKCGTRLAIEAGNRLLNENPLSVLVAVAGLIFLRHPAKWLLLVCYFVPAAIGIVVPTTTGGSTAGNTIVLFAVVSHFAIELSRRIRPQLGAAGAVLPLVGLLAVQVAWGHAGGWGWLFPSGSFSVGVRQQAGTLAPAELVNMTGLPNVMPTMLGGDVRATAWLGLADGFGRQPILPNRRVDPMRNHWAGLRPMLNGLAIQVPALVCLLAGALACMRFRRGMLLVLTVMAWAAAAQMWGAATGLDREALRAFDRRISVREDEKLVGDVQLSSEFREKLARVAGAGDSIELTVHVSSHDTANGIPYEFQINEWTADGERMTISAPLFLAALDRQQGRIGFSLGAKSGSGGLYVHSWRAVKRTRERIPKGSAAAANLSRLAEGRRADIVRADGSREPIDRFPSFEVRVVRGEDSNPLQSLFARSGASAAAYKLIGF